MEVYFVACGNLCLIFCLNQTVRVVEAASALARKVHLYELLALFQKTVDK